MKTASCAWRRRRRSGDEGPAAGPPLSEALRDEDRNVRIAAARALGDIKDPAAGPPLIEALRDEDSSVRRVAAWVLREIKDPAAGPLIEAMLDEGRRGRSAGRSTN